MLPSAVSALRHTLLFVPSVQVSPPHQRDVLPVLSSVPGLFLHAPALSEAVLLLLLLPAVPFAAVSLHFAPAALFAAVPDTLFLPESALPTAYKSLPLSLPVHFSFSFLLPSEAESPILFLSALSLFVSSVALLFFPKAGFSFRSLHLAYSARLAAPLISHRPIRCSVQAVPYRA